MAYLVSPVAYRLPVKARCFHRVLFPYRLFLASLGPARARFALAYRPSEKRYRFSGFLSLVGLFPVSAIRRLCGGLRGAHIPIDTLIISRRKRDALNVISHG